MINEQRHQCKNIQINMLDGMLYLLCIISLIKWLGQDAYLLRFQVSESVGCENLICILKCPDSNTDMYSFTIDINLLIWSLTQFVQCTYVVGYNINQIIKRSLISLWYGKKRKIFSV